MSYSTNSCPSSLLFCGKPGEKNSKTMAPRARPPRERACLTGLSRTSSTHHRRGASPTKNRYAPSQRLESADLESRATSFGSYFRRLDDLAPFVVGRQYDKGWAPTAYRPNA